MADDGLRITNGGQKMDRIVLLQWTETYFKNIENKYHCNWQEDSEISKKIAKNWPNLDLECTCNER